MGLCLNEDELRAQLKANLERVKERIERVLARSQRVGDLKILCASKGQPPEKIRILYELGIRLFGENYVQEGEKKIEALRDLPLEWHFIGRLQTNKVKKAVNLFQVIETLDRRELALHLEKRGKALQRKIPVFLEVNIGKEKTKAGFSPEELLKFAEGTSEFPHLEIRGLMCLPPYEEDPEKVRPYFARMRKLFETLKPSLGKAFTELSMGTSHDFEIALEEGATIIRLGTILIGKRE